MGNIVNDVVKVGSFGLIDDATGSEAAADAARQGARDSADAMLQSTEKNIDFQKWLWGEQKDLTDPWRQAGAEGLAGYLDAIS